MFIRATGLVDISVDDDLSEVIDFGCPVRLLWVWAPTLDSSTVDIQVSYDEHISQGSSAAPTNFTTIDSDIFGGAGTGAALYNADLATDITGFRWFKIATGASQTSGDVTFILGAVAI